MGQFGQITHTLTYMVPFHTRKLFTTLRVNSPSFSGRNVPLFETMLIQHGEGSGTSTEPHHTPSPEAQPSSHTHISSPTLPTITTIPTVTPSKTTPLRQYTRRARIAQSSALPPVADEPASPMRYVSQGEACPTDSRFVADQDRANIAKTSTLPHESTSRVTSLAANEGSLQLHFQELTDFCTSLQRQQCELVLKFAAQALEIIKLKARVKFLEDRQGEGINLSKDDAPIKGRRLDKEEVATKRVSSDTEEIRLDEWEVAAEKVSDDTEEMATVLITMDAASVLSSGGVQVVPTAATVAPANYQAQQRKTRTKKQKRDFYMAVIRNNLGWKVKDFKGMSFEEVEAKFKTVWEKFEGGVSKISEREAAWLKRKGIRSEQESAKKQKTSEEVPKEVKSSDEVLEEKIKELIRLVPIEEVYVEALQVKHLIIDWKIDREDLNQLWVLVKETLSARPPTYEKEMEL
nr:hypothetical protein [Tanacetum cinerariifolium]